MASSPDDSTAYGTPGQITKNMLIYFSVWYSYFVVTYGIWIPSGLFLPGLLIGCSLGMLYLEFIISGVGINIQRVGGQSFLVIGASAMLSSYTRLTYGLAVIMMETTNSINLFLPIMTTILVSNGISMIFNRSLYEYSIRSAQLPFLRNHLPKSENKKRIREVVRNSNQELKVLESVCSV